MKGHRSQGEAMHPVPMGSQQGKPKKRNTKCQYYKNGFCSINNKICKDTSCNDYEEEDKEFETLPGFPFEIGDCVWYIEFGFGEIKGLEKEYIIIDFKLHGIQKIRVNEYKNLQTITQLEDVQEQDVMIDKKVLWFFEYTEQNLMEMISKINKKILEKNSLQWLLGKLEVK